jgi:hypothetical protein
MRNRRKVVPRRSESLTLTDPLSDTLTMITRFACARKGRAVRLLAQFHVSASTRSSSQRQRVDDLGRIIERSTDGHAQIVRQVLHGGVFREVHRI